MFALDYVPGHMFFFSRASDVMRITAQLAAQTSEGAKSEASQHGQTRHSPTTSMLLFKAEACRMATIHLHWRRRSYLYACSLPVYS